jgi:23S rRNA pseudoU1915 N3-methylase RlmH
MNYSSVVRVLALLMLILAGCAASAALLAWALGETPQIISFGALTIPHQFVRVLVAEQVYRALTIMSGHPYHRIGQTGA